MNKKGYTRKPVIRGPLPEKDLITLCEVITWRAIGKAWPARRLKGWMKRNRGQRKPAFLWKSFEREADTVISLCGKGDLSPNGSVDGNPHQPFSEGYFLSDVYAEYVSDSIGPDPRAWPIAPPHPDEHDEEPKELPTYYGVQFFRRDLLSTFEPAAETDQAPAWGTQDDADPAQAVASTTPVFIKKGGAESTDEPPGAVPKDWEKRVVAWFVEEYVLAHADDNPFPTRDDSYAAARKKFPGWPIKRTETWREGFWRDHAPPEWKKRGPR